MTDTSTNPFQQSRLLTSERAQLFSRTAETLAERFEDAVSRWLSDVTISPAPEEQVDILDLATIELRLRRLAEEIGTTTRRINALESVVLPRLERERDQIRSVLDERERQDRFRLKRFTTRRARRVEAGEELR